jgi:hypothetical protein
MNKPLVVHGFFVPPVRSDEPRRLQRDAPAADQERLIGKK